MEIYHGTIEEEGSCNFCTKGKLNSNGRGLTYPYTEVITLKGKQTKVVFCEECFETLKNSELP